MSESFTVNIQIGQHFNDPSLRKPQHINIKYIYTVYPKLDPKQDVAIYLY